MPAIDIKGVTCTVMLQIFASPAMSTSVRNIGCRLLLLQRKHGFYLIILMPPTKTCHEKRAGSAVVGHPSKRQRQAAECAEQEAAAGQAKADQAGMVLQQNHGGRKGGGQTMKSCRRQWNPGNPRRQQSRQSTVAPPRCWSLGRHGSVRLKSASWLPTGEVE